jgi:outer membrane receptor protein involved in Fe transport
MFFKKSIVLTFILTGLLMYTGNTKAQAISEDDAVYVMPSLSIDADRATYQSIISKPQDEVNPERMEATVTHNPIKMIRAQNSSVVLGGGLGGATVSPRVRGLESRYTAVTIDGASVNTPWNWSSPLSGFPMGRLKRITLANTGTAMVYGQNTSGGAINFVLPSGSDLEGFTMTQEQGGEGTSRQEYIYGYAGEGNEHLIAIFNDAYNGSRRFDNGVSINNRNDNRMFLYKASFDLSHGWQFKPTIIENDGTITVGDAWGTLERFEPWKMSLHNYTLTKNIDDKSNFSLRYTKYNDYSRDVYYTDNALTNVMNPGKVDGETNVDMNTYEALYNIKANDKHYVNLGIQKQEAKDSHDSVSADFQKTTLKNTSFFVADSIAATDKLNLHIIARSDEDYEGDRDVSYSVNTSYDITDKTSLGFGVSKTMQLPTIQDLYRSSKGTYGNPNLNKEKSDSYEIRVNHEISDKWDINVTTYNYDVKDKITTKTAGELGLTGKSWFKDNKGNAVTLAAADNVKTNVQRAEISGFEIALNGELSSNLDAWVSYTDYARARDKDTKIRFEDIPEYRATTGLIYKENKTTSVLSVSHQGEIKATGGYKKVKASTLVDLSLREQIRSDFALYIKVANLTDKKDVVLSQNTPSHAKMGLAPNSYYYEDGRTVTMGMEVKF